MKNMLFKRLTLFCLAALLALSACACGASGYAETTAAATTTTEITTTATEPDPALIPLSEAGKAIYTVIRGEDSGDAALAASQDVFSFLSEEHGIKTTLSTDWVRRNSDPDAITAFEILVGETNRSASAAALGEIKGDTWCVAVTENRIIINASTSFLLADAVEYFKSICTVVDGTLMLNTALCKTEVIPNALLDADITLRVGSYNIKNGAGVNHDMKVLAEDIVGLNLDIVGLQEVDIGTSRAKGLDILKLLAEATGYPYYQFTKAINFSGGEYGTAILSRYPIVSHESVLLETPSGYEQRAYGHALIEVNGVHVHFFNTHLSYEKAEIRAAQMAQIAAAADAGRGYILTADFNTANLGEFKVFGDAVLVNEGKYPTFPSSSSAIDNIVLESGWRITDSGMLASGKSDHNLLWAEIHYEG